MKLFFLSVLTSFTIVLSAQVNNYQVGDIVNDFTVTDTQGNQYSLYDLTSQGKYVYLDFFYVSCSSCQSKISIFNEFWDKYGCGNYDVFCLAINQGMDDDAAVIDFENQYGGTTQHAPAISSDGGAAAVTADFGVNVFTTFCVISPGNKLLLTEINPVNAVKNLEDALLPDFDPVPMPCSTSVNQFTDKTYQIQLTNRNLKLLFEKSLFFKVSVYDLSGKELFGGKFHDRQFQLALKTYQTGIYFLQIQFNNRLKIHKIFIP